MKLLQVMGCTTREICHDDRAANTQLDDERGHSKVSPSTTPPSLALILIKVMKTFARNEALIEERECGRRMHTKENGKGQMATSWVIGNQMTGMHVAHAGSRQWPEGAEDVS